MKFGERAQTHAGSLDRGTGCHVAIDKHSRSWDFTEIFEQEYKARAAPGHRVDLGNSDWNPGGNALTEGFFNLPETDGVSEHAGCEFGAWKFRVNSFGKGRVSLPSFTKIEINQKVGAVAAFEINARESCSHDLRK